MASYPPELEAARHAVFQKVGHNVLRLQHMERLLKFLLGMCKFDGPQSEIKARLANQTSQYTKMTLGQLVAQVPERLFNTELPQSQRPAEITEPWFTFSFGFEEGNAVLNDWASKLKSIKDERNLLVHHFLERHQLTTLEGCDKASAELDSLLERTLKPYEIVLAMVESIKQHLGDIQAGRIKFAVSDGSSRKKWGHSPFPGRWKKLMTRST